MGAGEVGPWGSARTRWELERDAKLSLEGALELAWMMGLVKHDAGGFVEVETGARVVEHEVLARYEAKILAHAGVRVTGAPQILAQGIVHVGRIAYQQRQDTDAAKDHRRQYD